jgi:hypothetical protein
VNSIVWQNRSFYFGPVPGGLQNPGDPAGPTYGLIITPASQAGTTPCGAWRCWDLGVLGASGSLDPQYSVLTSTAGYAGNNVDTEPSFVAEYLNGPRNPNILVNENGGTATILVPAAFDEGGNFIRPIFGPLTLHQASGAAFGNHHVTSGVGGQALNAQFGGLANVPGTLLFDIDADPRPGQPSAGEPHRGADQLAAPQPSSVSVGDGTITEGNSGTTLMTFTVSLSAPSASSIDLRYTTTNGTAIGGAAACAPAPGQCDYVTIPAATVLAFSPGQVSQDVAVSIKGDAMYEGNQAFNLVVTLAPGETDATIADGTAVGTIVDDDPTPSLSINSPAAVQEPNVPVNSGGTAPISFTITLTGGHEQASSVVWSTQNGTAQAPSVPFGPGTSTDYLPVPGTPLQTGSTTVSFAPTTAPSQTANAVVQIRRNSAGDAPSETFLVNLGVGKALGAPVTVAPVNAVISAGQGTGTITNRP